MASPLLMIGIIRKKKDNEALELFFNSHRYYL